MASVYKRASDKAKGKAGKWTMAWVDEHGKPRTRAGFTDKTKSLELARHLEAEARMIRDGAIDPGARSRRESAAGTTGDHLEAYREFLSSKGGTAKHVAHVVGVVGRILADAGVISLADLAIGRIQAALGRMREAGKSARTCNHALGSVKAFAAWLVDDGRLERMPRGLKGLPRFNQEADRRLERRALDPDELALLLEAAEQGPPIKLSRRGYQYEEVWMTGPERAALYRLAMGTGFRADEIRTLTPERFDLEGESPSITVLAAYAKNGKEARQPITRDLASTLRPFLEGKDRDKPVLRVPEKTAKLLRRDLASAGIPYADEAGRVADFHALRMAYITGLVRSGANPRVVQSLARHSDVKLTLGVYTHAADAELRKALEGGGDPRRANAESGRRAMGSDGPDGGGGPMIGDTRGSAEAPGNEEG